MTSFSVLSVLLVVANLPSVFGGYTCNGQRECEGLDLSENGNIRCQGYQSCINAVKIERLDDEGFLQCGGAYSCFNGANVENIETDKYTSCGGLFSCAKVNYLYLDDGNISDYHPDLRCWGEKSCWSTTILNKDYDTNSQTQCYGLGSCADSPSIHGQNLEFYGAFSAMSSYITDPASIIGDIEFNAAYAGYGAIVECDGSCQVSCNSGTACASLSIDCRTPGCTWEVYCEGALQSSQCDSGFVLPNSVELPSLLSVEFSTFDNFNRTCNQNGVKNCADSGDATCTDATNGITYSAGPVCCTANKGCLETNGITVSASNLDVALRFDGQQSADDITGDLDVTTGGHVYFSGAGADSPDQSSVSRLSTGSEYDVIVTGAYAAEYGAVVVVTTRNVYCMAYQACQGMEIQSAYGNVYGYAYSALAEANISNIDGSIYGDGRGAFQGATITNVAGDIIAVGTDILQGTTIRNVEGTLVAYGKNALTHTIISGITMLYVQGTSSLDGADIISGNPSGGTFVAIFGSVGSSSPAEYYVTCSVGDTCIIVCSDNGCASGVGSTLLILNCVGTCLVACDDSTGDYCPDQSSGRDYIEIEFPTAYPTLDPTLSPSEMPTLIPTKLPTKLPTEDPSHYPTTEPSALPSDMPTTPTLEPTNYTEEPSHAPTTITNEPTVLPVDNTDQPSFVPTTSQSTSTLSPTMFVSTLQNINITGTLLQSILDTNQGAPITPESDKKQNNSAEWLPYLVGGIVSFCIICILIYFGCNRYHARARKQHESEIVEIGNLRAAAHSRTQTGANETSPNDFAIGESNGGNSINDVDYVDYGLTETKGSGVDVANSAESEGFENGIDAQTTSLPQREVPQNDVHLDPQQATAGDRKAT